MMTDRILSIAAGYYQLGMAEETLAELEQLAPAERNSPEALSLYTAALMKLKRWEAAMVAGLEWARRTPEEAAPYLDIAFCMHELGRTLEARKVLQNGPESLKESPAFYYNLACYEAQLGNLSGCKRLLGRAIEMDASFGKDWKADPDLRPLLTTES